MAATPHVALRPALEALRLDGAIFLRAEYSEGWAFESLDGVTTAALLHPGAPRLILFHVVVSGRCFVMSYEDGERHWANAGDVIVLPYGDKHVMGGVKPAPCAQIEELIPMPPWDELPVIVHGDGGERTEIVCGWLRCDDPLFDPELRAFPPAFVVRPTGPAARWVQASMDYALAGATDPGSNRLPELLLLEMLRLHLETAPAADRGWFAALRDPVLAAAMARLHSAPDHKWTVAELAATVAVSRSVLDERFRQVLGRSPIRYLTDWRMHVAEELLATTDLGVAAVARRVGYDAEESFSRAFKRARGMSPARWRSSHA